MNETTTSFDGAYNFDPNTSLAAYAAAGRLVAPSTGRVKSIQQIARELECSPQLLDYRHIRSLVPGSTLAEVLGVAPLVGAGPDELGAV